MPAGLTELLRVPGLGPKKVKSLHDQLGIKSLGELEYACNENRLVELWSVVDLILPGYLGMPDTN